MLQNRISKSRKMASLSGDTVRLLYTWMLSHLDVNGNFYADPIMVNNLVFTRLGHSVKIITSALNELEEKGLIIRYKINGDVAWFFHIPACIITLMEYGIGYLNGILNPRASSRVNWKQ